MNSRRFYYLLLGCLGLMLIAALAGAYFGRESLVTRNAELSKLKARVTALDNQERSLVLAKKDIEQYKELQDVAESIVPQEKDQARTVRELVSIAESVGVTVNTISFPSSNLGDETKKTTSAPAVSQVEQVKGIPGLFELDLTVSSTVPIDFSTLNSFLERLETNRRTSSISTITITPEQDGSMLTFELTLKIYIKP